MWLRFLAAVTLLNAGFAPTWAGADESLHRSPAGTVVSDWLTLAGKRIPLPPGEFILAATETRADVVGVFLAQLDGDRLRSAVWAQIGAKATGEDRLAVERRQGTFGEGTGGILKDAAAWLAYHDVTLPVPILVVAQLSRRGRGGLLEVWYAFNPWSYGCNGSQEEFLESVAAWGRRIQDHLDKRLPGSAPIAAGIHQCARALASAP